MWIIVIIGTFILGVFAFPQIIYPPFVAWPKSKRLLKENKLKSSIPISKFFLPPLVWSAILVSLTIFVREYLEKYFKLYCIVLIFTLIIVLAQVPMKSEKIEADLNDFFKPYLKDEKQ